MPATAAAVAALLEGSAITTMERDVVTVAGPDAAAFLQGQVSQDVVAMAVGAASLTFLLEPQGKVIALLRVVRTADDAFRLDGDPGTGPAVLARLQRYKLRTKADLALVEGASHAAARSAKLPKPEGSIDLPWPGLSGWDLPVDGGARALPGGRVVPPSALDGVRVAALVPAARDLAPPPATSHDEEAGDVDVRAIPAESGLVEAAASFTKGCYTGQELVERMASRGGKGPRTLRRLVGAGTAPEAGAVLTGTAPEGAKPVGVLTTVVPTEEGWAGLSLVRRAVKVGDEVAVAGGAIGRVEQ